MSHDETHPRSDLDIVRSGDLWNCHMLEVQRIAYNLSIPIGSLSKKAAIRYIEQCVSSGTFTIREPGNPIEELVQEIGIDLTAFLAEITKTMNGGM